MRLIEFTDRNNNAKGQIRAVKHSLISDLEILLPYRYRMLYTGFEGWFGNRTDLDLDADSISKCNNRIIVVNLDPKPIDYIYFVGMDREQAIESYKYIIANSSIITIELNDDKSLYDVEVAYEIKDIERDDGHPHLEQIYLIHEEDKYDSNLIDLTSQEY